MTPATPPAARSARQRLDPHGHLDSRAGDRTDDLEPEWLRDESDAEALADRTWSAIRWDPGRRGAIALVAVGVVVAVFAAVFFLRSGTGAAPVAPLPPLPAVAVGTESIVQQPESEPETEIVVSVVGLVTRSGLVTLPPGARVADALDAAGGTRDGADLLALNLAQRLSDGDQVVVGTAPPPGTPIATSTSVGAAGGTDSAAAGGDGAVSLSSATEAELDALPGVGPVTAASIVRWRTENGPFTSVDQLGDVEGIGPARLNTLRPLVTP